MSLFGRFYRVFTFGESHSKITGCVIEGFPSSFRVSIEAIQNQLNRRKPGQTAISTPRKQFDLVQCVSGLENNVTLGSPLCFLVKNENIKRQDYDPFKDIPRPGHADFTYLKKYGIKAESGGGRSSARETIGRVIAGALAKQYLKNFNIQFASWVHSVKDISIPTNINSQLIKLKTTNQEIQSIGIITQIQDGYLFRKQNRTYFYNPNKKQISEDFRSLDEGLLIPNIRCPHEETAINIYHAISKIRQEKDSLGGVVQGCIYNLPYGLGEPVFDKIQALMSHAMLSIPATKGFEFGSGFGGTKMKGSEHNDLFDQSLKLKTNHSGGSLGGITTGQTFDFKVAFKPVSTISKPQHTSNLWGEMVNLQGKGRHDPCVLPRAPPIVDNMAAMVIMDLWLSHKTH